jgi:hypothetical protein
MKMTRQALMYTVSLAAILGLSACGKTDESASQVPATPPPAVTVAAPAMAPPPSSTQAPVTSGSAMAPMSSGSSMQPPASSGTSGSGH